MTTCTKDGLESLLRDTGVETPVTEYPGDDILNNPLDIVRALLADRLQSIVSCDRLVAYGSIQTSNITGMGDLVVVTPKLKVKDVKPQELVRDMAQKFQPSPPFACPFVDGIHLRVLTSAQALVAVLLPYIDDRKAAYGYPTIRVEGGGQRKQRVVVEFSSPNMEREFQVSHLRSTLVGSFIARLFERLGWDVIRMNYLGDWGMQIGLLAIGWQRFGSEEAFLQQPVRHLLEVNNKIQASFKPEQDAIKGAKQDHKDTAEIETAGLHGQRNEFFRRMEDGDPEATELWQRFRDATVSQYTDSYAKLGVKFDEYSGESKVSTTSLAEAESLLRGKEVYEESDGSWIIDFAKFNAKGLSVGICRYRNGTSSYLLRDIAAVLDRFKQHAFDKMIYVVAVEQEMHFNRIIKALELMGKAELASKLQHVGFAKITGLVDQINDSKLLDDYIEGCHTLMRDEMPGEEEPGIYVQRDSSTIECLGLSGLIVQDLNHRRMTPYACDPKRMTSFADDTGVAFQNCHARISSKLHQGAGGLAAETTPESEDAIELLRIMAQYPDTVASSYKSLEPSIIVAYTSRLADQVMITLDADEDEEADASGVEPGISNIGIYRGAEQVLRNAMELMGLTPVGHD